MAFESTAKVLAMCKYQVLVCWQSACCRHKEACTMRFGSTAKVLPKCKFQVMQILGAACAQYLMEYRQ